MSDIFSSKEKDGLHIITLPSILDQSKVMAFEKAVKNWLETQYLIHIFDFKKVTSLRQSFFRPFFIFHKEIKAQQKQVKSVNLQKEITQKLKEEGLLAAINPIASVAEALKLLQPKAISKRIQVDADFINPFIESTKNCLKLQANLEVLAAKPILKPAGQFNSFQIGGQIKIQNDRFVGSVVIYFQRDVFFKIIQSTMGTEKIDETSFDVAACAGEILNIIFGQAKATLNDKLSLGLEQELPSILVGESFRIHEKIPAVVIPFESPFGSFFMEIGIVSAIDRG